MTVRKIDYFVYIKEWHSVPNKDVVHLIMGPTDNIHDLLLL